MGCCKGCIFAVPEPWHIIIVVMNVLVAGSGTFISAFCTDKVKCRLIIIGVLQFLLMPILIGEIWSVIHGLLVFRESTKNFLSHPLEYKSLEEFERASKVNLLEPVEKETLKKLNDSRLEKYNIQQSEDV